MKVHINPRVARVMLVNITHMRYHLLWGQPQQEAGIEIELFCSFHNIIQEKVKPAKLTRFKV